VAKFLKYYHLAMMVFWPIFAVPTLLWWRDSVALVLILSLYANFAGDFSGYQGARAEEENAK
jgi:hypothetical protein